MLHNLQTLGLLVNAQNPIKFSKNGVQNKLIIQPNPVENKAQLLLELAKEKYLDNDLIDRIEVYDIVGRNIHFLDYSIGKQSIELTCGLLNPGNYLVKVINQDGAYFIGKLTKK